MPHYYDLLRRIRLAFPQPVSDHIHDAYFSHLVHHALDRIDDLKTDSPFLGRRGLVDYEAAQQQRFPEQMSEPEEAIAQVASYLEGISIWGHPHTQENVVPPTSIPSVVAMMAAAIYNPNVIWDEYSHRVAEAEVEVCSMMAGLVGYDPQQAGGVFTFGGTGTILYGCRVGLCKALPQSMVEGVREDVKILCSDTSHYSKLNVASWLGLGARNVVEVPTTSRNAMDAEALESILDGVLGEGHKVAAIVATMGTTDAFGIDPLEDIVAVRDRLAERHGATPPHIHADAVIGWPWSVFNDYDFTANPLEFGARTLRSLQDSRRHIQHLRLADSIGVDFHKTGYSPYTSSLFLVRDRADFDRLSRDQKQMPYLYQFGEYHPGVFTLECSRNGGAILAALANLKLLGKEGYRSLLGHVVEMAERLREYLENEPCLDVLNDYNHGPVVLFRAYPPGTDAREATRRELSDPAHADELRAHNEYCRQVFAVLHDEVLSGDGVNIGLTDRYRETDYGEPVVALKSFIMSPFTDEAAVDLVVDRVLAAQRALSA
ncbi:MAG: aspartate aminotransferase family protein [Armatimonadetes bacterium]|nr:aspartate aminotransferase family protein [Armatimonadota bacterium]